MKFNREIFVTHAQRNEGRMDFLKESAMTGAG